MRIKFFEYIYIEMLTPWKRPWPPKFRPRGSSWPSTHKKLKNTVTVADYYAFNKKSEKNTTHNPSCLLITTAD